MLSSGTAERRCSADTVFFRFGVRQKVLLILSLVLLVTLTVSGWLSLDRQKDAFFDDIRQRGDDISGYVAKSVAYSVVGYDYHTIQLLLDEITGSGDVAWARVSKSDGKIMGESGVRLADERMRNFIQPIVLDGQEIGTLELGLSMEGALSKLETHKYDMLTREALIILVIVIGEFIALSFIIIQPVRKIIAAFANLTPDKQDQWPEIRICARDEFGQMADHFNVMSRRLNEVHHQLKGKIELADQELVRKNRQLLKQSNELRRMNSELRGLSITDELTGLYNRRHFDEYIRKEVAMARRYNQPLSLLLMDLDFFKKINDGYGHLFGDTVLRTVAGRLRDTVRSSDVLCRVGGEEFAVLCVYTGADNALQLAEKLRRVIENTTLRLGDETLTLTVSIGVATYRAADGDVDSEAIYKSVDEALYWSKSHGRNRVTHARDIGDGERRESEERTS